MAFLFYENSTLLKTFYNGMLTFLIYTTIINVVAMALYVYIYNLYIYIIYISSKLY